MALLFLALFGRESTIASGPLQQELFANIADPTFQRVMHIGPGEARGSIRVLGEQDVREFDGDGRLLRQTKYLHELWHPFPMRFTPDGPLRIVGLKSGFFRSWLDVLDSSAKPVRRIDAWQYSHVEQADVVGNGASELLLRYRDGVKVLDESGKQLGFVRSPQYLYHFRTIRVAGMSKRAIAFWMWRDQKRGTDVRVVTAAGEIVGEWNENPSDRFGIFKLDGEAEGLWSAVGDRFIERSPRGQTLRTLEVPGMGNFRYVYGGRLSGGRKVLLGAAGGYYTGALVCIFDADDHLIEKQSLDGQTWALYVPEPEGNVFFVGNLGVVWRFRVD